MCNKEWIASRDFDGLSQVETAAVDHMPHDTAGMRNPTAGQCTFREINGGSGLAIGIKCRPFGIRHTAQKRRAGTRPRYHMPVKFRK